MIERSADPDRPFNTLVVVDGDGLRASYRKIHLYDSFGFKESDRLVAGDADACRGRVAGLPVGLMTCYDLRFPELARELSRAGADAARRPRGLGRRARASCTTGARWSTARAIENLAYVAAVGQPGPRYSGHSMLVDPRGEVVGRGRGATTARSWWVEVSRALVDEARAENPSLLNRRDDGALAGATPVRGPGGVAGRGRWCRGSGGPGASGRRLAGHVDERAGDPRQDSSHVTGASPGVEGCRSGLSEPP